MRWTGSTRKEDERDKSLRNVWDGIYDWEEEELQRKKARRSSVYSYTSTTPRRSSVYTYTEKKPRKERVEYEYYTHTSKRYGMSEKDERRRYADHYEVPRRKSTYRESYADKPRRKSTYSCADAELDREERIRDAKRGSRRKSVRFEL